MPKDLVSVYYYCIWLCLQVQGVLCLLFIVRVPFFFSRVHISDFQNPTGLTKFFMIILILVLKFLFKSQESCLPQTRRCLFGFSNRKRKQRSPLTTSYPKRKTSLFSTPGYFNAIIGQKWTTITIAFGCFTTAFS